MLCTLITKAGKAKGYAEGFHVKHTLLPFCFPKTVTMLSQNT